jgi:hypothetical protein
LVFVDFRWHGLIRRITGCRAHNAHIMEDHRHGQRVRDKLVCVDPDTHHRLQSDRTAQVVIAGHAFVQNLRRGHYELGVDARPALRVAAAFTELAQAI